MACNTLKNAYYKSAQTAYNNATQTIAATAATMNILGTLVTDTGCALDTGTTGFTVNNSGLYRFSFDVMATSTATDGGTITTQMYNGTTALPCAIASETVAQNGVTTLHVETVLRIAGFCPINKPLISVQVGGTTGSVTHICASAVKLA